MKKRIMIDLDDTIVKDPFLGLFNQFTNRNYKEEDFEGYYIEDNLNDEEVSKFQEFLRQHPDMYANSTLIDKAIEVTKKLAEVYEVFICSAYYSKFDDFYSAIKLDSKYRFICRELPFIKRENIVFASNKDIINCEIKIDDKVKNLKGSGDIKILLTQRHNLQFDEDYLKQYNIIRVNNWKEIESLLLKGSEIR